MLKAASANEHSQCGHGRSIPIHVLQVIRICMQCRPFDRLRLPCFAFPKNGFQVCRSFVAWPDLPAFLCRPRFCPCIPPAAAEAELAMISVFGCVLRRDQTIAMMYVIPKTRIFTPTPVFNFFQLYEPYHVYTPVGVSYTPALCIVCSSGQRIPHILDRSHYVSHRRARFAGYGCHAICGSGQRLKFYFVSERKYSRLM